MQPLGHEFLAHAGLAEDQHGEVGAGDGIDLLAQPDHRGAAAEQLARAAALAGAGERLFLLGAAGHRGDGFLGRDAGFEHAHHAREALRIDAVEGVRIERVQRHQSPDAAVDAQRRAHAVVHGLELLLMLEQSVVGIRKAGIGCEAQAIAALQQAGETRVRGSRKAPPERLFRESVDGDRLQHRRPFIGQQAQQRGGVAGHQAAHGGKQLAVAGVHGQSNLDAVNSTAAQCRSF